MDKCCKTCKFWEKNEWEEKEQGQCHKAASSEGDANDPTSLAWAVDYGGYGAYLITRPNFGCVQWEKAGSK